MDFHNIQINIYGIVSSAQSKAIQTLAFRRNFKWYFQGKTHSHTEENSLHLHTNGFICYGDFVSSDDLFACIEEGLWISATEFLNTYSKPITKRRQQ